MNERGTGLKKGSSGFSKVIAIRETFSIVPILATDVCTKIDEKVGRGAILKWERWLGEIDAKLSMRAYY